MLAPHCPTINAPSVVLATSVQIGSDLLRFSDVVDLGCLPSDLAAVVADLPIVRLRPEQDKLTFTARQLRARLAGLMPALEYWLPENSDQVISVSRTDAGIYPNGGAQHCAEVMRSLSEGDYPHKGDLAKTVCTGDAPVAFRYEHRTGYSRATQALTKGSIVRGPVPTSLAEVTPGQSLVLEASVGPIQIQREVRALQPAASGQSLFARTSDGVVISIPFPEDAP